MIRYHLRKLLFWRYGFNHYNYVFWQVKTRFWNRDNSPHHSAPKDIKNRLRYYNWETGWTTIGLPAPLSRKVTGRVDAQLNRVWGRILWTSIVRLSP